MIKGKSGFKSFGLLFCALSTTIFSLGQNLNSSDVLGIGGSNAQTVLNVKWLSNSETVFSGTYRSEINFGSFYDTLEYDLQGDFLGLTDDKLGLIWVQFFRSISDTISSHHFIRKIGATSDRIYFVGELAGKLLFGSDTIDLIPYSSTTVETYLVELNRTNGSLMALHPILQKNGICLGFEINGTNAFLFTKVNSQIILGTDTVQVNQLPNRDYFSLTKYDLVSKTTLKQDTFSAGNATFHDFILNNSNGVSIAGVIEDYVKLNGQDFTMNNYDGVILNADSSFSFENPISFSSSDIEQINCIAWSDDQIIFAGDFHNELVLGNSTLQADFNNNNFVGVYNSTADTVVWAKLTGEDIWDIDVLESTLYSYGRIDENIEVEGQTFPIPDRSISIAERTISGDLNWIRYQAGDLSCIPFQFDVADEGIIAGGLFRQSIHSKNDTISAVEDDGYLIIYSTDPVIGRSENLLFKDVTIYPNPTKGEIQILVRDNSMRFGHVCIHSSAGQLIVSKTIQSSDGEYIIDISGSPPGLYFVTLTNHYHENQVLRFVKQ